MATTEEQLQKALAEQARLQEQLRKAKKKERAKDWKPDYPGQHRGY